MRIDHLLEPINSTDCVGVLSGPFHQVEGVAEQDQVSDIPSGSEMLQERAELFISFKCFIWTTITKMKVAQ